MKRLFPLIFLAATPAIAQEKVQLTNVDDACIFVARSMLMVEDIKVGIVQSFPTLEPPGARLTYSEQMDAEAAEIDDQIECQFEDAEAPFRLLRYCMDSVCYAADSNDPEDRRRFTEIRELMSRAQ
ncbi:hypothetical protein FE840_011230 [Peteryoungia desertarenae]|uniref:UrcA family protein n=1 Tax=Peteryoungia desertarenae TaxID=1813451 RepID=A0ABX6QNI6_9HYPH|nr:hypothetical protein [Peteryoungia desertarenae]QLF70064.1 hypothetical protein FE840_011230 [Peteryoungia desertarenae]